MILKHAADMCLPIGISIFAKDDSEIKAPLNSTIQIAKGS